MGTYLFSFWHNNTQEYEDRYIILVQELREGSPKI